MSQIQIAEMGTFDLNDWDDLDGLDLVSPDDEPWAFGDVGCSTCMGDLGAAGGGGFPWGTVLVGAGGVALGVGVALLLKKLLK